jgi:hypothetical protein
MCKMVAGLQETREFWVTNSIRLLPRTQVHRHAVTLLHCKRVTRK